LRKSFGGIYKMEWKKVMKLSVAPLAFSLMLVGCSNNDRTVATIDDIEITESELDSKLKSQYGSEVLDSIIANKIVELEAEKKKITVSDEEIAEEYKVYTESYGGEETMLETLKAYNMDKEDVKEDIRLYLLTVKLLEDYVEVTEDDVKKYFEENKSYFDVAESVEASRIVVEDETLAKEIIKSLDEGKDFAQLAKEHSTEDNADETGGSLGTIKRGDLDEAFEKAAFALGEGEYTKTPVKSDLGYQIIKVTKKTEAKEATYENSKEDARAALTEQKVNEAYQPWLYEKFEEYDIKTSLFK